MKRVLFVALFCVLMLVPQSVFAFCNDEVAEKYYDAAQFAWNSEILRGGPDGKCALDRNINRIEFAVMAMRAAYGDNDAQSETCSSGLFNDLNTCDVWYGKYAATAKNLGILKGDSNGNLRAIDNVNSAESAVISARASGIMTSAPQSGQAWYEPTYVKFKKHGVTVFDPSYKMTRGDVVNMLYQVTHNYHDMIFADDSYDTSAEAIPASTFEATPEPTPLPVIQPTVSATQSSIQLNYRVLVEYFEYLTPQDVATVFKTLTPSQILDIGIYSPFGDLVHLTACQADSSLVYDGGSGYYKDCAQQSQEWSYTPQPYFRGYTVDKRDALLISIKCSTGEIDAGSCGAYVGAMGSYGTMMNDTSMRIIQNIGGQCRIGEDPGCHW